MKRFLCCLLALAFAMLTACTGPAAPAEPTGTSAPANETTETTAAPTETTAEPTTVRRVDRRAEEIYLANPELTPVDFDSPALLPLCEDLGQDYIDSLTFICDSPTYWLKLYELLTDGAATRQIWTGPEGTMTLAYLRGFEIVDPYDGALRTIPETAALRKPEHIVVALGINGISFMDEAYFKQEYTNLLDELQKNSPESEITLQSIYPISPAYRYWGDITNASITRGNRWILEIAEEYGLGYLDTFSALVGENGNIRDEYVMTDGLHPNKDGLTVVLEYIRTHGVPDAEDR